MEQLIGMIHAVMVIQYALILHYNTLYFSRNITIGLTNVKSINLSQFVKILSISQFCKYRIIFQRSQ